ncbi:hypothetical protein B0H14DRAFT_2579567 [Mycena olivaceomarginata]|nr:hypothetical protein B0H14DRAFT_2579567 [Mycena olivaceomarginata]
MLLQLSALTLVLVLAVLPGSSAHVTAQPAEVPVISKALLGRTIYTTSINTVLIPSVTPLTLKGVATEAFTRTSELGKRANGDIQKEESFTNSKWTSYTTGLGACGDVSVDTDFIVALDQRIFGTSYPSPYCNRKITMLYGSKTTTATIKDSCLGCAVGGLDLSPGLFSFFANLGEGTIYGTWSFLDRSDNGGDDMSTTK